MKKLIAASLAILIWFSSAAALADPHKPRVFQTAPVVAAAPEIAAEGAAWLKRTKQRVEGRVMAKVDKPDTPYSIWWVIFNNPAACSEACGPDDVFTPDGGAAADVAVFNASGAISAASGSSGGVINVDLSVITGEAASNGSQDPAGPVPFLERDFNKNNGLCAEIHIDINEHVFDGDWVQELTYPENMQAFAVFPPADGCE